MPCSGPVIRVCHEARVIHWHCGRAHIFGSVPTKGKQAAWLAATPEAPAVAARQPHAYNDDGSDPGNCSVCHFYHR